MTDRYAALRTALDAYDDDPTDSSARDRFYGEVDSDSIRALLADYDGASARALHEGAVAEAAMEDNKRLREIVEMVAAGNAEYDVLQAAAQAALAQEQGESDDNQD